MTNTTNCGCTAAHAPNPVAQTDGLALVFDVETTGLWNHRLPIEHPSQPHVIQLGARLVNLTETTSFMSCIIRPEGFEIPDSAAKVHKITQEYALRVGVPLESALALFASLVEKADELVAHNIDFDVKVLVREFTPMGLAAPFADKKRFCTMKESTDICKLPKKTDHPGYKWPQLVEAYRFAFGCEMDGAHDAWADINATLRLWRWLKAGAPLHQPKQNPNN